MVERVRDPEGLPRPERGADLRGQCPRLPGPDSRRFQPLRQRYALARELLCGNDARPGRQFRVDRDRGNRTRRLEALSAGDPGKRHIRNHGPGIPGTHRAPGNRPGPGMGRGNGARPPDMDRRGRGNGARGDHGQPARIPEPARVRALPDRAPALRARPVAPRAAALRAGHQADWWPRSPASRSTGRGRCPRCCTEGWPGSRESTVRTPGQTGLPSPLPGSPARRPK